MAAVITALLLVAVALLAVAALGAVFYDGSRVQLRPGGLWITLPPDSPSPNGRTLADLATHTRLALAGSATLMLAPAVVVLHQLRRLFGLYGQGVVLTTRNVVCLERIALALVAYAVAPALGHLLVTAAGFDDQGWLRLDSIQALVLGGILWVMARVMRWGAEVHDDASRFV